MNYPLITEYVEAIKLAEENLDQMSYLHPVLDDEGRPVMSSGNFAVVFKMKDERNGKLHALKCFIKEQEGRDEAYKLIADELEYVSSDFITPIKYLEKELFVDTNNSDVNEFPVLLMDWEEGVTLDKYIREHLHDQYALHLITFQFCRLASWLMAQSFAHGDLKPDNILVKEDGSLVLVDYDGMFVPAMKGQKAREMGSPDYRHPLRTVNDFNEHIDDFSLATIAMQLYAIAIQPSLLSAVKGDTLLLTEADYRSLDKSQVMPKLLTLVSDTDFSKLLGLFFISFSENSLSKVSFRAFNISKPIKSAVIPVSTELTNEDFANGIKDEFGAIYSPDGKRLLSAYFEYLINYEVKPGTTVICDYAFDGGETEWGTNLRSSLIYISIPDSVTHIGDCAFCGCWNLCDISIPESVIHIGHSIFGLCSGMETVQVNSSNKVYDSREKCNAIIHTSSNNLIAGCCNTVIPNSVTHIGEWAFSKCENLTDITIPNSVTHIGEGAFSGCENLTSITIPNSVTHIGDYAFSGCENLTSITIPNSVTHIGDYAFSGCENLTSITIPDSVIHIDNWAFSECKNLTDITIPDSVTHIGERAFFRCNRLSRIQVSIDNKVYDSRGNCNAIIHTTTNTLIAGCDNTVIPDSVTQIGDGAFSSCNITTITIPDSVTHIGKGAFSGCRVLTSITIPNSVTHIGDYAFSGCKNLTSITIPNSVTHISTQAFSRCENLSSITIPNSVTHIGDYAFSHCYNLNNITIPDSVKSIGGQAFFNCKNLDRINIPNSVTLLKIQVFEGCEKLKSITIPNSVKSIGYYAFSRCKNLSSITIPNSVTYIGKYPFMGCDKLTEIRIPAGSYNKFKKLLPGLESKFIGDIN